MTGRRLLALNVRKLRVAKGLSQEALAAETKLDRAYLGKIERQEGNPSLDVLERIARKLGVGVAALFNVAVAGNRRPIELQKGRKSTKGVRKRA